MTPLLDVRDLVLELPGRRGPVRPVNGVTFSLPRRRIVAVLGESGSGKSMLLKTIMGIQPSGARVSGEARMDGVDLLALTPRERRKARGSSVAMVFQNPMTALDPTYRIEDQLVETIRRHRDATREEARGRALELLKLVQIPSPEQRLGAFPFECSGGMRQRIVLAIALACEPSLLLADEPTTALDVTVQAHLLRVLRDIQRQLGMSVAIVTHDIAVAAEMAEDVIVMYAGRIVESGPIRTVLRDPRHPYTRGLLRANITPGQTERPMPIPGSPPDLAGLPDCCSFAPRCTLAEKRCWGEPPELLQVGERHIARCRLTVPARVDSSVGARTESGIPNG